VRQILDSGPSIDELFDDQAVHDPREALRTSAVPICYLHGRNDAQVPLEVAKELAELTPLSELVVIDNAGHMPHQEQPSATNAALRRFIVSRHGRAAKARSRRPLGSWPVER
jgi:non-heme chloroperoxidase